MVKIVTVKANSSTQNEDNKVLKDNSCFFKKYQQRIITSIVLIMAVSVWMFIGAVYLEPIFGVKPLWSVYTFMVINTLILIGCLWEIINLKQAAKWPLVLKLLIITMGIIFLWFPIGKETFGPYLYNHLWFETWMSMIVLFGFIAIFLLIAYRAKTFQLGDVLFVFLWVIYLVLAFKAVNFLMLSQINSVQKLGWPTLLFLFVIVMSNDIGAFIGGVIYGKNKLAPRVSPNKTWEGAITGIGVAMVLSMITVIVFLQTSNYNLLPFYEGSIGKAPIYIAYVAVVFILSLISQMGDLLFSYLKRNYGVKDFSNIFPGHGGLLDRLDSFSGVAIAGFIVALLFLSVI